MNLKLDLNTAQFRAAAQDAVRIMGANAELLIKEEAKYAIRDYVKLTPPFATGAFNKSMGSASDKKAGELAVKGDVGNVATGAQEGYLHHIADTFGTMHIRQQLFKKGTKKPYLIDWDKIIFTLEELKAHHLKKRNSYGRTPKQGKGMGSNDKNIGRWKAREKVMVPIQILNDYIKFLMARVGTEKAAFSMAAQRVGLNLPPWVKKTGLKGGYFEEKKPTFSILISGKSQRPQAGNIMEQVVKKRGQVLEREVKRIITTFQNTGKVVTRRASFNESDQ